MIVVTTPSGHIGSQVVVNLLAAGAPVRVIARDPARLPAAVRAKVEIVQGSSDDQSVLMRALEGADSLFLIVPPSFIADDVRGYYLRFTRPACRAIETRRVARVVSVSGIGRGVNVKAGPVTAAFAKDAEIERTGVNFRALWCPGFMENMLRQVDALKHQGAFFSPSLPDVKAPLVATRDIAASAATLLLDRSWTSVKPSPRVSWTWSPPRTTASTTPNRAPRKHHSHHFPAMVRRNPEARISRLSG